MAVALLPHQPEPASSPFSKGTNAISQHGLIRDGNGHVNWTRTSPDHPRNWSFGRKVFDTGLVIFLEFFTTAVSTAGAPAAEHSRNQLGLAPATATCLFVSIYLLAQGLGGTIFPPYSECFGRKKLYIGSTILYSIFCALIGALPTVAWVAVGRLTTGFLSSIPAIVVAGSIEDMWDTRARIWLVFVWSTVANMGLVVGPMISTSIITSLGWHWVFFISAMITALISLLLLFMKESRPSVILSRKVAFLRKATGDSTLTTSSPDHMPDTRTFIRQALFRPLRLFLTEPLLFAIATTCAIAFGLIYLFTDALPLVYSTSYQALTPAQTNYPFLALGLGLLCAVLPRLRDARVFTARRARGAPIPPEAKLTGFAIATPLLAVGLWWFAWTVPPAVATHWAVPTAALVLVGFALNEIDAVLAGYLADSYASYAASGFGALSLVRCLFSAVFPLFGRRLFADLGFNVAGSVVAVVATVFCVVPVLLVRFGEGMRKRSRFARWSGALEGMGEE